MSYTFSRIRLGFCSETDALRAERDALKAKCERYREALDLLDTGDRDAIVAAYPQLIQHFRVCFRNLIGGLKWEYKSVAHEANAREAIVDRALRPEIVEEVKP